MYVLCLFSARLLHVQNANCKYHAARETCAQAFSLVELLSQKGFNVNCAILYSEQCGLLFAQSLYDEVRWSGCSLESVLRENGDVEDERECFKQSGLGEGW